MSFDCKFRKCFQLVSNTNLINKLKNEEKDEKPNLFPEKEEVLGQLIRYAYYSKSIIEITFYENNKIKTIKTIIKMIDSTTNTLKLGDNHIICFNQIIDII